MLAHRLTTRRGAWVTLAVGVLTVVGLLGLLRTSPNATGTERAPTSSESTRAARILATLPGHDVQSVLLVATRSDGARLTPDDLGALGRLAGSLPTAAGHPASTPTPSDDGRAAVIRLPIPTTGSGSGDAQTVTEVRHRISAAKPSGLDVLVTGGPAYGADIAKAFDGANITLLLVTVGIVALLLLLTYRSPVLWLVPLLVVALADQVAAVATARLGRVFDLQFDAGIVSVLVFGAGTNYALLLISRYREELHGSDDHRAALAAAWRHTVPAIVASNLTVVLALSSLAFASIPGTRGLGIASGLGLLVALVLVITLLPAALAVAGRRIFWPFVPTPDNAPAAQTGLFARVAAGVMRRPAAVVIAGLLLLATLASGLLGTRIGLSQTERFRTTTESAAGLQTLAAHFPAGTAQPILVVTDASHAAAVADAATAVPGVRVMGGGPAARPTGAAAGSEPATTVVTLVSAAAPGTAEARAAVEQIRAAVRQVPGADALVGGAEAVEVDARAGNEADLRLIVPVVLVISGVVLLVLLRSVLAPLLLLPVNALSAVAAIGAGSWVGRHLFDWPALDLQVPLFAFLFLVALGIDYTIFLVHRARTEADGHGTVPGMIRAVASTGTVITSAGVVLAAVFAALGVLPLVTLGQLGLIVGLGVLLDTVVVRTLIVPALAGIVGDRLWWPGRPTRPGGRPR